MKQLSEHGNIMCLAGIVELGETGNYRIVSGIQKGILVIIGWMEGHAFNDDQSCAAPGPGFMIGDEVIRDLALMAEGCSVGRIENAILDRGWPKADR